MESRSSWGCLWTPRYTLAGHRVRKTDLPWSLGGDGEVWKEGDTGTGSHAKSKLRRTTGGMWQNWEE